jgi:hypothetical protein
VPKKFAVQQGFSHCSAIALEKWLVSAPGFTVDEIRQHFLAHPGLAQDEHSGIRPSRLARLLVKRDHRWIADDRAARRVAVTAAHLRTRARHQRAGRGAACGKASQAQAWNAPNLLERLFDAGGDFETFLGT